MAKRNSSGPSSGRRGSRTEKSGPFSSRGKSQQKSFKRSSSSDGDERKSNRYDRPERSSGGKGRYDRADKSSGSRGRYERPEKSSGGKSRYEGSDSSGSKGGYGKDRGGRSERFSKGKRSSSSSYGDSDRSSKRSYRSDDRSSGKSRYEKRDESSSSSRSRSSDFKSSKPRSFREGSRSKSFDSDKPQKRSYSDKKFSGSGEDRRGNSVRDLRKSDGEERGFFKKSKARFSDSKPKVQPDLKAPVQTDKVRLNKYIANSGVCSRREADELISMGLISVNGKTVTELGYKVNPGDEVRYENKVLKAEKPVYILMNKPKGYLTTTDDPQERNTVMHIIGGAVKERIYPVGRLDRNTTGLLLLTNDGDLADKLMHPSHNIKKIYKVELDRPLTKADFQKVQEGVLLEEGRAAVDDVAIVSEDGKTVGVEIHIGWNRVVRRIFEALNYEVIKLDRSVYAGLDKKDLSRGQWRFLKKEEIVRLKHFKQE